MKTLLLTLIMSVMVFGQDSSYYYDGNQIADTLETFTLPYYFRGLTSEEINSLSKKPVTIKELETAFTLLYNITRSDQYRYNDLVYKTPQALLREYADELDQREKDLKYYFGILIRMYWYGIKEHTPDKSLRLQQEPKIYNNTTSHFFYMFGK